MLFFRYLFDISSLRMNPCSPRFVYLFVVLRILVRAVNFHIASLRVSEGRTMLASVIQSGSRLEVKSRTEFVENVPASFSSEIPRISNFTSKLQKKVHPRKVLHARGRGNTYLF